MRILSLDGGSSSLKVALYDVEEAAYLPALVGEAKGFGQPPGRLRIQFSGAVPIDEQITDQPWDAHSALNRIWRILEDRGETPFSAVGHRIVFGGPDHSGPVRANASVLHDLEAIVPLDPLHLRAQLDMVYAVARRFPDRVQVLCFDTAFHRNLPPIAKRYPLPRNLDPMIQRYGFHGLSYEYVLWKLTDASRGRVIIAHLGNGASLCALRNGAPIDTTMGFSVLGGLMMGTRPGDLDPGVLLYMLGPGGYQVNQLTELLSRRAGLLGVSESSANMQTLLSASDAHAREAVDLFVYQLVKHVGALIAILRGLDLLVFTGGIGENAAEIRSKACKVLDYVGLRIDERANDRGEGLISRRESPVRVRVVKNDENLMIARHTASLASP